MAISAADKQDALDGYLHYSRVLGTQELREFYSDLDFLDLCNVRALLADADLTEQQTLEVKQADQRLAAAFDSPTLSEYSDYFPELPISEWWGRG